MNLNFEEYSILNHLSSLSNMRLGITPVLHLTEWAVFGWGRRRTVPVRLENKTFPPGLFSKLIAGDTRLGLARYWKRRGVLLEIMQNLACGMVREPVLSLIFVIFSA